MKARILANSALVELGLAEPGDVLHAYLDSDGGDRDPVIVVRTATGEERIVCAPDYDLHGIEIIGD